MSQDLPPLNWLRTFESAARHSSLTRAADELHVTPSAVSQQVRALEDRIGVALFRRVRRRLFLTDAGQAYMRALGVAFDGMRAATSEVHGIERTGALAVRAPSSFSAEWLMPRLGGFHTRHPEVEIRFSATVGHGGFERDGTDIEIRYGDGQWSGLEARMLVREEIFPVCAPRPEAHGEALRRPADLATRVLLDVPGYEDDWDTWLDAAGVGGLAAAHRVSFDQSVLAIEAAVNGVGIALGRTPLVAGQLALGRLIEPFELRVASRGAYYVVYPPGWDRASADRRVPRLAAQRGVAGSRLGSSDCAPGRIRAFGSPIRGGDAVDAVRALVGDTKPGLKSGFILLDPGAACRYPGPRATAVAMRMASASTRSWASSSV